MAKTNRSTATRFFLPQQHLEWEIRCNVQLSSRWVVGFLCSQNSPTGSFSLLRDGKSPNSPTIRLNMTCHHRSLQKKTRPHPVLGKRVCLGALQGFLCTSQLSSIRSFLTSKSYACHDDKQTYITMAWSHNALSTFTGTHFKWPKNTAGSCCQWVSMENPWTAMLTKRKWHNPWSFDVSWDSPSTSNDHYKGLLI